MTLFENVLAPHPIHPSHCEKFVCVHTSTLYNINNWNLHQQMIIKHFYWSAIYNLGIAYRYKVLSTYG